MDIQKRISDIRKMYFGYPYNTLFSDIQIEI